ncbi:MAG: CBS domain-containing protein [Bryobacteraceae bacterium]|jgi:sporulation protein YlmC with PRC-barrel domain/CBS domain-containing protein
MAENLLFFTELLRMPVYDVKGRRIGRVRDAALVPVVNPSQVDRVLIGGGDAWFTIRYDQIRSISLEAGIALDDEQLTPYHDDEYMLRIGRDLLDQQIIDVTGRKVVRVTDLTFDIRNDGERDTLVVVEVDIGIRSIFRRLLQGVVPPRWIRRLQLPIPPSFIKWDFCNVVEPDPLRRLRLNISYRNLEEMHPADLADIVEDLSPAEREAIFETIDSEAAADALSEVDPKMQASILESLEPEKAADIVEEMAPDEAADALNELEEQASEDILEEMDSEPKTEVQELLEYEEDTAGGMMNTEYVALPDAASVQDALPALRSNEDLLESLNTLFLIDPEGRPTASIPLARLFISPAETRLKELASESLIAVPVDEAQNRITELFDKYNLLTLPVVDEEGKLAGIITADDIISVLRSR